MAPDLGLRGRQDLLYRRLTPADTRFDGRNQISLATGSQWDHEALYRSRRGRYYIEHWSQWQGSTPYAEYVDERAAARWLLVNNETLPNELGHLRDEIEE